jgi:hypothetical protein
MGIDQLMGRYVRLKQELAVAYNAKRWQSNQIDRLANDIAAAERQIAAMQPVDEQCSEAMFHYVGAGRSAAGMPMDGDRA